MNLNKIDIEKTIKDKIVTPIPEYLIKEREGGGGKKLSYISGSTVTDMLNNYFGYAWNWTVKQFWIQESQPAYNKYVNGSYQKDPNNWVLESQGPVAHVLGTLTIQVKNNEGRIVTISKDGFGSKSVIGKQNEQESVFKAAGTDALKKAASLLGIGLELYRDEEEQAYFYEMSYENPWTQEELNKYSKEWNDLSKYIEDYKLSDEDIRKLVLEATGSDDFYILPQNIQVVYDYILNTEEKSE